MDGREAQSVLSREEFENAVQAFSDADWLRLQKVAKLYATSMAFEDLVQEAFSRALGGTRQCPRDVSVVRFLAETVRSIASDDAEKVENKHRKLSLDDNVNPLNIQDQNPSPEEILANKQSEQKLEDRLLKLFEGDQTAQLVVLGILEGSDGAELRELAGLDTTQFNSKRRKIRRTINQASQNGFKL